MKILYTADTHLDHRFLQDLANKAIDEKAILLHGGDFIDIYERGAYPIELQLQHCTKLVTAIQRLVPFYYSQGNHDIDPCVPNKAWVTWDAKTHTTDECVITILKYNDPSNFEVAALGAKQRDGKPWVIVCHEPPFSSLTAGSGGSKTSQRIVKELQPDFFLCGHHHLAPFSKKGSHTDIIGSTTVLNPGKRNTGRPNFFTIEGSKSKWYSANALRADHKIN